MLGPVAGLTVERGVRSVEPPARERMVEGFPPLIAPPNELELPTVVIDMATAAVGVVRAGMQTLPCIDPIAQNLMTLEAQRGRDSLAGVVALEAVGAAFEGRMDLRQLPGRQLAEAWSHSAQTEDGHSQECEADPPPRAPTQGGPQA